jgi:hypothetical protein
MSRSKGGRGGRRSLASLLALVLVSVVAATACSVGGAAFDPTGPCLDDGQAAGAYPELEALIPTAFEGEPPGRLDSGRNCTPEGLGPLVDSGIEEVRFAGGLWELGSESGTTLAVFSGEGITAEIMGRFYHQGADEARKTEDVVGAPSTVAGRPGYRLDLTNDGYLQTVVTWPSPDGAVVRAALVSSAARDVEDPAAHEAVVERAIAAFEG